LAQNQEEYIMWEDREFLDLFRKHKYALIRPTDQELWWLQVGGAAGNQFSEQIELAEQIQTLRLLPMENWKSHEYKGPREFYILSNEG
jgi:hypothetical protein